MVACNHVHLLVQADSPLDEQQRLAKVMAGFSRRIGNASTWQPLGEPRAVPDRLHLQRTVRYVHLNPCRWRIVGDPLCWPYSTHRDLLGAVVDPWTTQDRMARAIGLRGAHFPEWYHRYVSTDPDAVREARIELRAARPSASFNSAAFGGE